MFHSNLSVRQRSAAALSGVALVGSAGAGLATASEASSAPNSTLSAIRYCESHNNYRAQNPSSSASGAYQILDTTWRSLSAGKGYARAKSAPASVQDAAALQLYRQQGTSPWAASSSCWGR